MKIRLPFCSDTLFKASLGCFLIFAAVGLTHSLAGEGAGFRRFIPGKAATKLPAETARLVETRKPNPAANSTKKVTVAPPPLDVSCSGNAVTVVSQTSVTSPGNALGAPDGTEAQLWETGDLMVLQLTDLLDAGSTLTLRWRKDVSGTTIPSVNVEESVDGTTFTTVSGSPFTVSATSLFDQNITSAAAVQYVRISNANGGNLDVDAISYANQPCTPPTGPGYAACVNPTEIGGIIFMDANGSATQDNQEQGASGITVKAYDADDAPGSPSATTTSNTDGEYLLTGLTGGTSYRVEFSWSDAWLESGVAGGSTVQFVTAGVCNANVGLLFPAAFCQNNPDVIVPCYVNGDPLGGGTSGTMDAVVQIQYTATNTTPSPAHILNAVDVGTVWGSALQRETQQLFQAAFLKRHCGLGTLGLGGIYKIDMSLDTPTVSNYVDLETLGVDLGASQLATRDLPASATASSYDTSAFRLVGKTGLGGLDLSDDGTTLWSVNLYQKKLLKITIGNPAAASISSGDVQQFTLPNPGCTNGQARPWAVEEHKGLVYVGMICSGENGGSASNLSANIYTFDPAAGTFSASPVLSFSLNYTKGDVHASSTPVYNNWETWANAWSDLHEAGTPSGAATRIMRPQPMLSDIQFDRDDNMMLGFFDRNGHLTGRDNRNTTPGSTELFNGYVGGEMLMAANNGAGWTLESNGSAGSLTGCGAGNGQGIGGGEFFCGEYYSNIHEETFQGGMIYLAGEHQLVANLMDPLTVWTGGFGWFNAATGNTVQRYQIYNSNSSSATFGKANGLGLMEAFCDPAPLELGNRIWMDADNDGIQDPGEMGIDGVVLKLFKAGVEVASTTSAGGGLYGFSNAASGSASGFAYNVSDLDPGMTYEIRIENASGGSQQGSLAGKVLTTANNGGGDGQADLRDSDGSLSGTSASVSFTTGGSGENRHDFDFGFGAVVATCSISATFTQNPVVDNGTPNDPNDDYFTVETNATATNGGASGKYEALLIVGVDTTVLNPGGTNYGTVFTAGINLFFADSTIYAVAVRDLDIPSCIADPPYLAAACVEASFGSVTPTVGTCNGSTPNDDASIVLAGVTNADEVGISLGATYSGAAYGNPSNGDLTDGGETFSGLLHSQTYTLRIWSGSPLCYLDTTLTTPTSTCACANVNTSLNASICAGESYFFAGQNLTSAGTYADTLSAQNGCDSIVTLTLTVTLLPDAGEDVALVCQAGVAPTSHDFNQAGTWSVVSQPAGANAQINGTGNATNLSLPGVYVFRLTENGCFDEVALTVPNCACPPALCVPVTVTRN